MRRVAVTKTAEERLDILLDFIDANLPLNEKEEKQFQRELAKMTPEEQEGIRAILAGWQERKQARTKPLVF